MGSFFENVQNQCTLFGCSVASQQCWRLTSINNFKWRETDSRMFGRVVPKLNQGKMSKLPIRL
ncbi:hypothetical protein Lalb_Chr12g0208351 [Lupinus albus]|uniref:Uncharacterized protein n=1 Tax=Lupinus albus TaxID=3870 RepID=A0A6A4PP11_LUPAL|nr:hypothetical protein Lalb_Chr12g0208351 [Lupinus albus]